MRHTLQWFLNRVRKSIMCDQHGDRYQFKILTRKQAMQLFEMQDYGLYYRDLVKDKFSTAKSLAEGEARRRRKS